MEGQGRGWEGTHEERLRHIPFLKEGAQVFILLLFLKMKIGILYGLRCI